MIELAEQETVIGVYRKHWFVFVAHVLPVIFLFFMPTILFALLEKMIHADSLLQKTLLGDPRIEIFARAFWLLVIWILIFIIWTDYYLDVWILTNSRIIDIEQKGFFAREVASFRYEQIQDITVTVSGFIPTMLNFGTLHVQTAGASPRLEIRGVADPNKLRDIISQKLGSHASQ